MDLEDKIVNKKFGIVFREKCGLVELIVIKEFFRIFVEKIEFREDLIGIDK